MQVFVAGGNGDDTVHPKQVKQVQQLLNRHREKIMQDQQLLLDRWNPTRQQRRQDAGFNPDLDNQSLDRVYPRLLLGVQQHRCQPPEQ